MKLEVRDMRTFARSHSMPPTRDDQLTARCRAGDVDAFSCIYAGCERQVFRYAYHLLGNRDDADDVKQETFVKAWQAIRSFKGECAINIWLLRICANLCRDKMRALKRRNTEPCNSIETDEIRDYDQTMDPHRVAERRLESLALKRALSGIPAAHREIIVLRELEDLSYSEIASALQCSIPSVKIKLFRARRLLKDRMISLLGETL